LKNGEKKDRKATIQLIETNYENTTIQPIETIEKKESDEKSERMERKLERKENRDRKIIAMLTKTMERKRAEAAKHRRERFQRKMNPIPRRSESENPLTKLKNHIFKMAKNLTRRSNESPSFVFFVDPANVSDFVKDKEKIRT
jgi:hypothetical protein